MSAMILNKFQISARVRESRMLVNAPSRTRSTNEIEIIAGQWHFLELRLYLYFTQEMPQNLEGRETTDTTAICHSRLALVDVASFSGYSELT